MLIGPGDITTGCHFVATITLSTWVAMGVGAFLAILLLVSRVLARRRELRQELENARRAEASLRLDRDRLQVLLKLSEMTNSPLDEIADYALEEAVRLTRSEIGYIAFLSDDERVLNMHAWSKSAMASCATGEKIINYPVEKTGLWGEAVRQRRPIITNDYDAPNPLKKGCPRGHVKIRRHMNAPVFSGARIVIVAGVGNKREDYDDLDVEQLTLLMKGMWDLIENKRAKEQLHAAAHMDVLTGLANRAMFIERLTEAIQRRRRSPDRQFGVLFLDLDRFKLINDSLGHEMGDLFLKEVAARLRQEVRSLESLSANAGAATAARLGGDEFVVLLDGMPDLGAPQRLADRVMEALSHPFRLRECQVCSTASIGIVTSEVSANRADDVLRDADTAMYEAKAAGRGRCAIFDVSMRHRVQAQLALENDLRGAAQKRELSLAYQPIISLESGELESFEALLRWNNPRVGPVSPAQFIPIAEETGTIVPIGEWTLTEACRQYVTWKREGRRVPPRVSVNLSRIELMLPDLPERIRRTMERTGMAPQCLQIEITENSVMQDAHKATEALKAIKQLGVTLAMDDFGTGYSSLACLHQFPFDVLKIDRSFVANIDRGRDFTALVHAIALLARNLGISVVAEGIETAEQLATLQTLECQCGQGYLFSRPLPPSAAIGFRLDVTAWQQRIQAA